jgi:hypothetical protein
VAALVDDLNTPKAAKLLMPLAEMSGDAAGLAVLELGNVMGLRLK